MGGFAATNTPGQEGKELEQAKEVGKSWPVLTDNGCKGLRGDGGRPAKGTTQQSSRVMSCTDCLVNFELVIIEHYALL